MQVTTIEPFQNSFNWFLDWYLLWQFKLKSYFWVQFTWAGSFPRWLFQESHNRACHLVEQNSNLIQWEGYKTTTYININWKLTKSWSIYIIIKSFILRTYAYDQKSMKDRKSNPTNVKTRQNLTTCIDYKFSIFNSLHGLTVKKQIGVSISSDLNS